MEKEQQNNIESKQFSTLRSNVLCALNEYFVHLDGQPPANLYTLVMEEVEAPLLQAVLNYTKGKQTRAAEILGLSRGTLRKKLKRHGLDKKEPKL